MTDYSNDYIYDTFLPSGKCVQIAQKDGTNSTLVKPILIVASIVDSLGGLTNLTQLLNVSCINKDQLNLQNINLMIT